MKFYGVVLKSGESGIFNTWPEAQQFIRKQPSGASYKRFDSKADAESYIQGIQAGSSNAGTAVNPEQNNLDVSPEHAIAYVDGSFNARESKWGFGVVLFASNNPEKLVQDSGSGTVYAEARNVTGEIYGAMRAVQIAIQSGFRRVTIYHDYMGVAAWVTGAWQAKQDMTVKYTNWMRSKMSAIDIKFVKVDGHTGVQYNELADQLAKSGCGMA